MEKLTFDGQVAIVTGAGRGIGRSHALLLARRGARVVVNGLGVSMNGTGTGASPAGSVVEEIRSFGGSAIADGSDIATAEGARQLVATAIAEFGQVDILLNNAGIYAEDAFPAIDRAALERQLHVHLFGSFHTAQECYEQMLARGYGRILMTTSAGALGDAKLLAYGTAKAAVLGFTRSLAVIAAGSGADIKVNGLAPSAITRMSEAPILHGADPAPDPDGDPGLVAVLAAVLLHRTCPANGEIYTSGRRRYARLFISETAGYVHDRLAIEPEQLLEHWDDVHDETTGEVVGDTTAWSAHHRGAIARVPISD